MTEAISFENIVDEYLKIVPRARENFLRIPDPPRSYFEAWPDGEEADLFDFLPLAFVRPILLPALESELYGSAELDGCFQFIEGLAKNRNSYVQSAIHFEVYQQFLKSREILLAAYGASLTVTKSQMREMLVDHHPSLLNSYEWWPDDSGNLWQD